MWFLSFGRWEDKRTVMGYANDFQDPRVLGNLILPLPGEGDTLEFTDLAASQVWAGVHFALECLGGRRGRKGADIDSDALVPTRDQRTLHTNEPTVPTMRPWVRDVAAGSDSDGPVGSSCFDDGMPSEPPPPPPSESNTL